VKIPFLTIEKPEFKPRPHLGLNPNLTEEQKLFIDLFDVQSQDIGWLCDKVVETRMIVAIGVILFTIINGAQIYELLVSWFKR
jgi:hypothetical protein